MKWSKDTNLWVFVGFLEEVVDYVCHGRVEGIRGYSSDGFLDELRLYGDFGYGDGAVAWWLGSLSVFLFWAGSDGGHRHPLLDVLRREAAIHAVRRSRRWCFLLELDSSLRRRGTMRDCHVMRTRRPPPIQRKLSKGSRDTHTISAQTTYHVLKIIALKSFRWLCPTSLTR